MSSFLQNLVNALQAGSFYALIALGYSMVYSVLMLFNFAHGDIFMAGAYIGFFISTGLVSLGAAGYLPLPGSVLLVLTIVLSMIATALLGVIIERIGYRPLRNAPRASAAITGLMIGIILETGNLRLFGAARRNFPTLIETRSYEVAGVNLTNTRIVIVVVAVLLMLALHQFVRRTMWGMAMRAMAYDYVVVPLMGVSASSVAVVTFALGSSLAAAAGILYGIAYPVLDPYMGVIVGWKAFVAAILGGRGSIIGAALAGFLLGFIEIFVATYFPSTVRDLVAYSIILVILTFRPHGFFGEAYSAQLRL